jgi:1,4-dihydroxy-2-naphthoyl-CoA hydrolase
MSPLPPPSPEDLLASMPYAVDLGIHLDRATASETRGSLRWAPELTTLGGGLHGGALMALAGSVGAICAYLNLPVPAGTAAIDSTTNFFRPLRDGTVHAVASPLHVGRSFIVVQTELRDDQMWRIGMTTQTQAATTPKGSSLPDR